MNLKYIIIAAVVIMLMVAFGRNPIEEAREERAEARKKYGDDPLIQSIQEHNAKGSTFRMGSGFSGVGGGSGYSPPPTGGTSPYTNSYAPNPNAPSLFNQVPATPTTQAPAPATTGQSGYYPPPPEGQPQEATPNRRGKRANRAALPPRSANEIYLPDGRKVKSVGARLYTYDMAGNAEPLADGIYPPHGNQPGMVVRGGRRVFSSN